MGKDNKCPHCGNVITPKKSKRFTPDYSFIVDIEMYPIFAMWCTGKSKKYKNQLQVEAGYKKLLKLSDSSPLIAVEIVENSLAANWEGLFPLKNRPESKPDQETDNRSSYDRLQEKYGR